MNYWLGISVILSLSLCVMFATKKNFTNICIIIIGGIIFTLYIFGLAGNLILGVYFIYMLAFIAFIGNIFYVRKKETLKINGQEGLFAFLAGSVIIYFITMQMGVSAGDEFTHWGSTVKNMVVTNKLGYHPDNWLYFSEYLPGTAIMQYFFCFKTELSFNEANIYRAMDILLLAGYLPVFSLCNKKGNGVENLVVVIILLLFPMLFMPKTWMILQVDSLLVILFANALLIERFWEEDKFKHVYMGILLGLLALVKESGLALAGFILAYTLLERLINKKRKSILLIYALIMTFVTCSWKWMINLYGAAGTQKLAQKGINLSNIWEYVSGSGQDWQYETARRFFEKFLAPTMGSNCPMIIFTILMLLFPLLIRLISRKYQAVKMEMLFGTATFILYSMYLLSMYLFMWDSRTGLDVTSFWRYMGTFISAWLLYYLAEMFVYAGEEAGGRRRRILMIAVIGTLVIVPVYNIKKSFIPIWKNVGATGRNLRKEYLDSENFAAILDWRQDRVFIVSQFSARSSLNYLDYWVTRYNIAPVKTNEFPTYSFGDTGNEKDIDHIDMGVTEWEKILAGSNPAYTYVYICGADDEFIRKYGRLFENNQIERGLYAVNKRNGSVELEKLDIIEY